MPAVYQYFYVFLKQMEAKLIEGDPNREAMRQKLEKAISLIPPQYRTIPLNFSDYVVLAGIAAAGAYLYLNRARIFSKVLMPSDSFSEQVRCTGSVRCSLTLRSCNGAQNIILNRD
jgi:hypothetical protein